MIKYPNVKRISSIRRINDLFDINDVIEISEKVDGSNTSFCVDNTKKNHLICFSRETEVTEENRLKGFYGFVNEEIAKYVDKLNSNYVYFGEWLIKHRLKYDDSCYKKFYLFDIYDKETEKWLSGDKKQEEILFLKDNVPVLNFVPYITTTYGNLSRDYYKLRELINFKDGVNKDNPEGFVMKSYEKIYLDEPCFFKIVNPEFEEVKMLPKDRDGILDLVSTICTKNRVYKIMYKLLDDNILIDDNLYVENMGNLIKIVIPRVYQDIIKEEKELIEEWKSNGLVTDTRVQKAVNKIVPRYMVNFIDELE